MRLNQMRTHMDANAFAFAGKGRERQRLNMGNWIFAISREWRFHCHRFGWTKHELRRQHTIFRFCFYFCATDFPGFSSVALSRSLTLRGVAHQFINSHTKRTKNFRFSIVSIYGLCDLPKFKINGWIYFIHCCVLSSSGMCAGCVGIPEIFHSFFRCLFRFRHPSQNVYIRLNGYPLCGTNDLSVAICTTFIVILRKLHARRIRSLTTQQHKWAHGRKFSKDKRDAKRAHNTVHHPIVIIVAWKHHRTSFCICVRACVWSSTSDSEITEIAIVAYLTLVNDNASWLWQIDSLPFQIINRLCARLWESSSQ